MIPAGFSSHQGDKASGPALQKQVQHASDPELWTPKFCTVVDVHISVCKTHLSVQCQLKSGLVVSMPGSRERAWLLLIAGMAKRKGVLPGSFLSLLVAQSRDGETLTEAEIITQVSRQAWEFQLLS